ncbi:MAG TPA: hypothetical protein VIC27_05475, partial [Ktedonobacterales bacterium]
MSQTTFDPTTPGGPSDETGAASATGETHTTPRGGQSARRRPSRRGHAASAKAAETAAQPASSPIAEHEPGVSPVSAASAGAMSAATSAATPTPDETGAHAEGRSRRSRGGAKRAAPRSKASAQLIIARTGDDAQSDSAAVAPPAEPGAFTAQHVSDAAVAAPVVVPVVTSSGATDAPAEAAPPATAPRKTRFGLPRRLQKPEAAPAAAPLVSAQAAPSVTETAPAATLAKAAPAETPVETPAPRYRFDRTRRTTVPGVAGARPERLGAQRPSLYTSPEAVAPEGMDTPATPATPATQAAPEPLFDLPPLESLVSRETGADLPTLAFDEAAAHIAATADDAEQLNEGADAADLGDGAGASARRRRRRRRSAPAHNGAHGAEADESAEDEDQPMQADDTLGALYDEEPPVAAEPSEPSESSEPHYQEPQRGGRATYAEPAPQRGRNGRFGYSSRTPRRASAEPAWDTPQQPAAETSP